MRPLLDKQVHELIAKFESQDGEPGSPPADANLHQGGGSELKQHSYDNMQRVHARARRMLDEQLELVPDQEIAAAELTARRLTAA